MANFEIRDKLLMVCTVISPCMTKLQKSVIQHIRYEGMGIKGISSRIKDPLIDWTGY